MPSFFVESENELITGRSETPIQMPRKETYGAAPIERHAVGRTKVFQCWTRHMSRTFKRSKLHPRQRGKESYKCYVQCCTRAPKTGECGYETREEGVPKTVHRDEERRFPWNNATRQTSNRVLYYRAKAHRSRDGGSRIELFIWNRFIVYGDRSRKCQSNN